MLLPEALEELLQYVLGTQMLICLPLVAKVHILFSSYLSKKAMVFDVFSRILFV